MSALWPAVEVETLVSSYRSRIVGPDGTIIRKNLDNGLWEEVAQEINTVHSNQPYHLDKHGFQCSAKIESMKANFENKELMLLFVGPQRHPDPLRGVGSTIKVQEHVEVVQKNAKSEKEMEAEIERVACILQKVGSEITVEKAFLEIEGPGNISLETFRNIVRNATCCDDYVDALKTSGFNGEAIRKEIDASRESLLKIENFRKEIAKEEARMTMF